MLAGFTRQTYSLAVIMLETTQQIDFFIPITLTILVSAGVGKIFN
jgi:H+/Cl- antiporter ClcA